MPFVLRQLRYLIHCGDAWRFGVVAGVELHRREPVGTRCFQVVMRRCHFPTTGAVVCALTVGATWVVNGEPCLSLTNGVLRERMALFRREWIELVILRMAWTLMKVLVRFQRGLLFTERCCAGVNCGIYSLTVTRLPSGV